MLPGSCGRYVSANSARDHWGIRYMSRKFGLLAICSVRQMLHARERAQCTSNVPVSAWFSLHAFAVTKSVVRSSIALLPRMLPSTWTTSELVSVQGAEEGSEQHAWWKVTSSKLRRTAQLGRPAGEQGWLVTMPDVCSRAVEQREATTLAVALEYTNAEIVVEVVSRESLQDAPSGSLNPNTKH